MTAEDGGALEELDGHPSYIRRYGLTSRCRSPPAPSGQRVEAGSRMRSVLNLDFSLAEAQKIESGSC